MKEKTFIDPKKLLFTVCKITGKANKMIYEDIEELLNFSLKRILASTGGKVAVARIVDKKGEWLMLRAFQGASKEYEKKPAIRVGESIAGETFERGKTLTVSDLRKNHRYKYPEYTKKEGIFSLICTPLISEKEKIGTFSVYFSYPRSFSQEEKKFFEIIGSFLAIILIAHEMKKSMYEEYLNTIKGLISGLEAKDPYTKGHSERVCKISVEIAKRMKLPSKEINILKQMGILHDIGKLTVDIKILHKKSPLNEKEWKIMKSHPLVGFRFLKPVKAFQPGLPMVRSHHERIDGKGYPDELKGNKISKLARIIAVSDAFDAMISSRPYRERFSLQEVKEELKKEAGKQFDKKASQILLSLIEEKRIIEKIERENLLLEDMENLRNILGSFG